MVERKAQGRVVVRQVAQGEAPRARRDRSTADAIAAVAETLLHAIAPMQTATAARIAPSVASLKSARFRTMATFLAGLMMGCFAIGFVFDVKDGFRAGRGQAAMLLRSLHSEPTWERKSASLRAPLEASMQLPADIAPAPVSPAVVMPPTYRPAIPHVAPRAMPFAPSTASSAIPTFDVSELPVAQPEAIVSGQRRQRTARR